MKNVDYDNIINLMKQANDEKELEIIIESVDKEELEQIAFRLKEYTKRMSEDISLENVKGHSK